MWLIPCTSQCLVKILNIAEMNKTEWRMWDITFGGDVTVNTTWPCAVPFQSVALFETVINTAKKPDHGHKVSEYEKPTYKITRYFNVSSSLGESWQKAVTCFIFLQEMSLSWNLTS